VSINRGVLEVRHTCKGVVHLLLVPAFSIHRVWQLYLEPTHLPMDACLEKPIMSAVAQKLQNFLEQMGNCGLVTHHHSHWLIEETVAQPVTWHAHILDLALPLAQPPCHPYADQHLSSGKNISSN
jgi:hypothetical protein